METIQDVSPIIERNKIMQNQSDGYISGAKEWRHAAHIPNTVITKWENELGVQVFNPEHWPAVKRLLNSNEYRHLRTALWNL